MKITGTVGILGPALSYSDLALNVPGFFAHEKFKKIYFSNIREVIEAVAKNRVDYAIAPIENNIHGTVRETEDNLFRYEPKIIYAFSMPIHHALIAHKSAKINDIKKIFSHAQALEQCENFLRKEMKKAQKIPFNSTSQAVMEMKKMNDIAVAAIGPIEAVKNQSENQFGALKILKKNIENHKKNQTTFIVIGKTGAPATQIMAASEKSGHVLRNIRTSIVFWFGKDQPGTLYQVLGAFAEQHVNLTKIESRPTPGQPGEYVFFLDFEGNEKDPKVKKLLQNIKKITAGIKNFGSYAFVSSSPLFSE